MMDINKAFEEFIEFPEGSSGNMVTTVSTKLFAKHYAAQLQEENERLLAANRHSEDMYRQIDDERKQLQAEVERLREVVASDTHLVSIKRLFEAEQERDELKAQVNALTAAISASGVYKTSEELCNLLHSTPDQCLAVHDAELIQRFAVDLAGHIPKYSANINLMAKRHISQLRQKTKESSDV